MGFFLFSKLIGKCCFFFWGLADIFQLCSSSILVSQTSLDSFPLSEFSSCFLLFLRVDVGERGVGLWSGLEVPWSYSLVIFLFLCAIWFWLGHFIFSYTDLSKILVKFLRIYSPSLETINTMCLLLIVSLKWFSGTGPEGRFSGQSTCQQAGGP